VTYGVAKKVNLVGVKVLDCGGSGTNLGVIKGINWVALQCSNPPKKCTANMSLGGGFSQAVNDAITALVNSGVTVAVAAGNENTNAGTKSPASAPLAITVGATGLNSNNRASFSNYGSVVDVFAPGTGITSAWIGNPTATNTISGTSMATPHVCGVASILRNSLSTPAAIAAQISADAQDVVILDCPTPDNGCSQTTTEFLHSTC